MGPTLKNTDSMEAKNGMSTCPGAIRGTSSGAAAMEKKVPRNTYVARKPTLPPSIPVMVAAAVAVGTRMMSPTVCATIGFQRTRSP